MAGPCSVGGWLSVWWLVVSQSVGRLVSGRSVIRLVCLTIRPHLMYVPY